MLLLTDALDTISDMLKMNALKTDYKKPTESSGFIADYGEEEEDDGGCSGLAQNNNGANVLAAQKQKKDAIAAVSSKFTLNSCFGKVFKLIIMWI